LFGTVKNLAGARGFDPGMARPEPAALTAWLPRAGSNGRAHHRQEGPSLQPGPSAQGRAGSPAQVLGAFDRQLRRTRFRLPMACAARDMQSSAAMLHKTRRGAERMVQFPLASQKARRGAQPCQVTASKLVLMSVPFSPRTIPPISAKAPIAATFPVLLAKWQAASTLGPMEPAGNL
jgi:hypothetical protein